MPIRTYNPAISVTLFKNIDRQNGVAQRYSQAQRTVDLTPYLGDSTTILINKDLQQPDGTWRIILGDQVDPQTMDTIYAIVEPMDVIEIRGSTTAFNYSGDKLPLLMRGFVSTVRRAEAMGANQPQRTIVISGGDWGKLWMIHGVWMEVALQQEAPLLTTFQLQAAAGMSPQLLGASAFMQQVTTEVINRKIGLMYAFQSASNLPQFTCQATVTQGLVMPQAVGMFSPGPFWNLVKNFSDAPWNELWIDDSDEIGPALIFRPTPFMDINGNWLGGSVDPGTIPLDIADVTSIEMGRSDANVANFFWTPPGASMLYDGNLVAAGNILQGSPFDFKHPNNEPGLYGQRKMEWPTQLMPGSLTSYPVTQSSDQQNQSGADTVQWHIDRANLLRDMNQDNALFEEGTIRCRGREDFRPGKYLSLTRGKVTSKAYIKSISHSITPFGTWQTTLSVDRGTGFLERNKLPGSPYWSEGRGGVFGSPTAPAKVGTGGSAAA